MANELRLFTNYLGGRLTYAMPAVATVVVDGVSNSTTTITSATAAFTAADVGATVTGTDIPAGAYIASFTNSTTVVLSAAATGTGSARTWTINRHLTMHSAALAAMGIVGTTNHMMAGLDPDGMAGAPEVVMVTRHDSAVTWAQIARAQEGTTARAHTNSGGDADWIHGAFATDLAPAYIAYTPTISQNGTRTTSALIARYRQIGKHVHAYGHAVVSDAGTAGNSIGVTLPTNNFEMSAVYVVGSGFVVDIGTIFMPALVVAMGGNTVYFTKTNADVENWIGANPSFALASGDKIMWNVTYEAA